MTASHLPNEIPSEPRTPVWRRVSRQQRAPLISSCSGAAAPTILVAEGDMVPPTETC